MPSIFVAGEAAQIVVQSQRSLSSTLQVLRSKCSTYMAVRTRSGRRSGATPLNGGADHAPYEWKLDALLTVVYLAVLYYWR